MESDLGRRSRRRPGQSWRRHGRRAERRRACMQACEGLLKRALAPGGICIEYCFPPRSGGISEPEFRSVPLSADALLLPGFDRAAGCPCFGLCDRNGGEVLLAVTPCECWGCSLCTVRPRGCGRSVCAEALRAQAPFILPGVLRQC